MRTTKRRGRRWGERVTHTQARIHSWRYTTRLYGVPYLKTVFLVTTVRLLKFHRLFMLKVICWITLQWWVSKEPTDKMFYFGSFIWNVEKSYSEWLTSSWEFSLLGCDTVSLGDIPDILKHRGAFILNCLILEEEGVTILWKSGTTHSVIQLHPTRPECSASLLWECWMLHLADSF